MLDNTAPHAWARRGAKCIVGEPVPALPRCLPRKLPARLVWPRVARRGTNHAFIGQKVCKNEVCGMTSVISLPLGDEVKVTQKGDDGHSSAIINSALYSAHGGRNQLCAIMSKIAVELAIQIVCHEIDTVNRSENG